MKRERSKWEIISDILKVVREEEKAKKTRIMQKAYLDWRNFQKYFEFLLAEGFIKKCNPDPGFYEVTESGKILLNKLKEIGEIMGFARKKKWE